MSRSVDLFLPLTHGAVDPRGPFLDAPRRWLPAPAIEIDDGWLIEVQAGLARAVVSCELGDPLVTSEGVWRTLRWIPASGDHRPSPKRLLPVLDAQLGIGQDTRGAWSLVLTGHYEPPAAWFGEVADAMLLHRVARTTLRGFLIDVARGLRHGS